MKKYFTPAIITSVPKGLLYGAIFAVLFFSAAGTNAQNLVVTKNNTKGLDEQTLRQRMKADGVSDAVIDKLLAQRKIWIEKGKNVNWTSAKNSKTPITNAICGDMGVENGWSSWSGKQGDNGAGPSTNITYQAPSNPPPTGTLFNITSGTGIDPNTPSAGNPTIPVVCPGFGNHSIVLNQSCTAGLTCEQLTYPITVTLQDTNFVYANAIVIENAGHAPQDQPFVEFGIYDSNGNIIPCSHQLYTGGPNIPGFYFVNGNGCGYVGTDQYKPWTTVGINLAPYIGQTLNIVITNADCDQGGHFATSYWDFACGSTGIQSEYCTGNFDTLCAPSDPSLGYIYQWYKNGNYLSGQTSQCIVTSPQPGDTFSVLVQQPSGCDFTLKYVPQDTCLNPNGVNTILNGSSVSIFPNPSSGNLFIDFGNKNFGKAEIIFSDVIGKTLYETTSPASGKQALDISEFSKGIYFLKLKTDTGIVTKKIVIAK